MRLINQSIWLLVKSSCACLISITSTYRYTYIYIERNDRKDPWHIWQKRKIPYVCSIHIEDGREDTNVYDPDSSKGKYQYDLYLDILDNIYMFEFNE